MYRQTVARPQPEQTQLQQLLRRYTSAVAGPEWAEQDTGGTSESARAAITDMNRILGSQPPNVASSPIHGAFLSEMTVLASARNTRILDAKPRIPGLLWAGLIFGGVVIVTLTAFLRLGHTLAHAVLAGTIAVLLGLLLCIIFTLDHPFGTHRGITSAPFKHSLGFSTQSTAGHDQAW
jgi:Protein of unknown function (DUF4239)